MGSKESDKSLLKIFALFLIGIYQKISKYTPATCRFYPTCSEYTRQAIVKYGFWKGCFLGMKRILKCHPWHEGGYDPLE